MGLFKDKIEVDGVTGAAAPLSNKQNRQKNRQDRRSARQDAVARAKEAGSEGIQNSKDAVQDGMNSAKNKFEAARGRLAAPRQFMPFYRGPEYLPCFRVAVNTKYISKGTETARDEAYDVNADHQHDATTIFLEFPDWSRQALMDCQARLETTQGQAAGGGGKVVKQTGDVDPIQERTPFDRRLDRIFHEANKEPVIKSPFQYNEGARALTSTVGLLASEKSVKEAKLENEVDTLELLDNERKSLQKDTFYIGVPSLVNTYSLTKLYGSEGGETLINQRGERRWYEVDQAFGTGSTTSMVNYASNPTTSSLISWGNADPYGRQPYHFTDFAFAKYWNKIENNRLITLRRYAAPILDNLKFPGMGGMTKVGNPGEEKDGGTTDKGSAGLVLFPPMASAITYFGGDTGNNIGELLKFTSGMKWDEAKAEVWEVGTESTPDNLEGPGKMFGRLAGLSKMLAVAGGDTNNQLIMNEGRLPPDPYHDGPYENRILGPVNRIDAVKKRAPGLEFEWGGLNLDFEYVARPIGGINTKAVLLDILSNFLIIGSASAVFFGGQHRFMGKPAKYPFLGGEKGIEAWYSGKPVDWATNTISSFTGSVTNPDGGIAQGVKGFFDQLLGGGGEGGIKGIFGAVKGLFAEGGIGSNVLKHTLAAKTAGQVPYLQGLKALLTGEPVGEWHVTIGNPLNPIAMIGNLICTGVEVEFNDELGPDDFPTEIKITVKLDHAMARDRDAIQSIFNRGMGRIYDLPDEYEGTADGQSKIDRYTANANETGTAAISRGWLAGPSTTGTKSGAPNIKEPVNQGNTSVWANIPFRAVSPNESLTDFAKDIARSQYRSVDWVALKSLK